VANLCRIVVGSFSIALAATNATGQSSGSTVAETVVTVHDRDLNGAQRASEMSEEVITRPPARRTSRCESSGAA
jgi:hypothetical protein